MLLTVYGTEWPILWWCAVKKLLTHSAHPLSIAGHLGLLFADIQLTWCDCAHGWSAVGFLSGVLPILGVDLYESLFVACIIYSNTAFIIHHPAILPFQTQNFPISEILLSIDIWHLFGLISRIPGLHYGFFLFHFFLVFS